MRTMGGHYGQEASLAGYFGAYKVTRASLRRSASIIVLMACLACAQAHAQQLPTGGSVAAGGASIASPSQGTLNINQSTDRAIINWQSFSVGAGGTVNFNQPSASSATLNRVTGATPSSIFGTINAPGTVLLVNPNGIAIGKNGVVNVGSFAASTLDIKNSDFMSGKYSFSGNGASASVTNSGRINVSDGGFAALLGGRVANEGVISARLGKVGLGSGELITLDLSGDGFLSVAVPSNQLGNLVDASGKALVTNSGKIRADGGAVFLSAATASTILRDAVNVPGSIRANTVGTHAGKIVIGGGSGGRVNITGRLVANGGRKAAGGSINVAGAAVHASGKITASGALGGNVKIASTGDLALSGKIAATGVAGKGGAIDLTGANIKAVGALIDASGATGGGTVRIGGGYQGTGDLAHAQAVSIDSASVVRADATSSGNGGAVVVWSDGATKVSGAFSAKGGANGGNGGLVETSGHTLEFTGTHVNTSAAKGHAGTWLLDPADLIIDTAAAATISSNLANNNVAQQASNDLTVTAPIVWASSNWLTLNAGHDIKINGTISGVNGGLSLIAGNSVTQTAAIKVSSLMLAPTLANVTLTNSGNAIRYIWTDLSGFGEDSGPTSFGSLALSTSTDLTIGGTALYGQDINLTVAGTLTVPQASSLIAQGNLTLLVGNNINSVPGSGIVGRNANISANGSINLSGFTVGGDVSVRAGGNIYFDENVGFGTYTLNSFNVRSDNGNVTFRSGRRVNTSGPVTIYYNPYAATGSYANTVDYSSLTSGTGNGSVTAYMLVNNLNQLQNINTNLSGTYALGYDIDASATAGWTCSFGVCAGFKAIGYGVNGSNTAFSGVLDGQGHVVTNLHQQYDGVFFGPGGLIWTNNGTVRNIGVAGGSIAGTQETGGLVAINNGTISNSFSTASVREIYSSYGTGGLVGRNNGTINGGSYATGSVTANGSWAGGLVGDNYGRIQDSYATGNVSGSTAGGLVGVNELNASIQWTYALGSVYGYSSTGGLVGENKWSLGSGQSSIQWGSIQDSYAAGFVNGSEKGGLVGRNDYSDFYGADDINAQNRQSAQVLNSYFDPTTTGVSWAFGYSYQDKAGAHTEMVQNVNAIGGNGAYDINSYGNFQSFTSHWYIVQGATRPFLTAEYSTNIQNLHQLQLIDMNGGANYTLARDLNAATELSTRMWNSATGFASIAPADWTRLFGIAWIPAARVFSGTFDGQGHAISNLSVTATSGNAGLFSAIGSFDAPGGTVKNLGIVDGVFTTQSGNAGAIAGENYGTIFQSYASRTTSNTVNVNSGSGTSGGLVGFNNGTVSQSFANVSVQSASGNAGGLIGSNVSNVVNSYALGVVSGNNVVGGLAGNNDGSIVNSFAAAQIVKANNGANIQKAGGLVGQGGGTATSSYYDQNVAAIPSGTGTIGSQGTGLTTAQMQDLFSFKSTYANWDFYNVWAPPNQAGQGGQSGASYADLYWHSNTAWIQVDNATRSYGDPDSGYNYNIYGLNPLDRGTATISSSANASSGVGTYSLTAGGTSGYRTLVMPGTLTITPRAITVTVDSGQSKTYGSADPRLSFSVTTGSLVNGDSLSGALARTAGENVGSYTINAGTLGGLSSNYTLSFVGGSFTITPATLTVNPNAGQSKTYGDANPSSYGYTFTGLVNGDNASLVSGAMSRVAGENAGSYGYVPGSITAGSNYNVVIASNGPKFVINPATLTITPNLGQGKIYGDTDPLFGYASDGFRRGDQSTLLTGALGRSAGENVGSYGYVKGSLSAGSNYTIVIAANGAAFAISPATLTVAPNSGQSKIYGDDDTAFGYGLSGFKFNDGASLMSGGLSRGTGENVGNYAYGLGSLSAGSNYVLAMATNPASFAITPATLTITPNTGQSKIYGDADTVFGYGLSGFKFSDGASLMSGGLSRGTGENVGLYAYGLGSLSAGSNYVLAMAVNPASFAITPATLTVTPNSGQSKIYGDADAVFGYGLSGFKFSDGSSLVSGVLSRGTGENVGLYAYGLGSLSAGSNYVLAMAGNPASFAITPATLTVTPNSGQAKIYGAGDSVFDYGVSGFKRGETSLLMSGLLNRDAGENVGNYAYGLGSLSAGSNYVLAMAANPASFAITPATLTVTPNAGQSKIYGYADPVFGYGLSGLQFSDGASLMSGGLSRGTGENVGNYAYGLGSLSAGANYVLTMAGAPATFAITPRPITVTADPQSRLFGAPDPVLTWHFTSSGLAFNDTLSGALTRVPGEQMGSYPILQGSLSASANYSLTFIGANFDIKMPPVNPPSISSPPPVTTPTVPVGITFQDPTSPPGAPSSGGSSGTSGDGKQRDSSAGKPSHTASNDNDDTLATGSISTHCSRKESCWEPKQKPKKLPHLP